MAQLSAVMHLYNISFFILLLSIPFYTFFKSGTDESMEWSPISVCSSLSCFLNRASTGRTNSLEILHLMFVFVCFVLYKFVSGLIL